MVVVYVRILVFVSLVKQTLHSVPTSAWMMALAKIALQIQMFAPLPTFVFMASAKIVPYILRSADQRAQLAILLQEYARQTNVQQDRLNVRQDLDVIKLLAIVFKLLQLIFSLYSTSISFPVTPKRGMMINKLAHVVLFAIKH